MMAVMHIEGNRNEFTARHDLVHGGCNANRFFEISRSSLTSNIVRCCASDPSEPAAACT